MPTGDPPFRQAWTLSGTLRGAAYTPARVMHIMREAGPSLTAPALSS